MPPAEAAAASSPAPSPRTLRIAYAVAGLVMAVMWIRGSGEPAWEHAARVLAIVLIAPPLVRLLQRRRRRRTGRAAPAHPPLALLVTAKVLLVAAALGCDALLGLWLTAPSALTALALFLLVALAGPAFHRRHTPRPAPDDTAGTAPAAEPALTPRR